jgi:Protein of unknown function (DUF3037)
MTAKYSIIQYVPDVIANERINIGVFAFDGSAVQVTFLTDWSRVECFANRDISFLHSFVEEMTEAIRPSRVFYPTIDEAFIRKMIGHSVNSIQLTEPRSSLKEVGELLVDASRRFLTPQEQAAISPPVCDVLQPTQKTTDSPN